MDYYVWQPPGSAVAVHLHFAVVDRILSDVMRGFAAIPKRGAEVGGILIGAIEPGEQTIVRIDDFEPVKSKYKHGPSYLLDEEDRERFAQARRRWSAEESPARYAVGFYRSHTRDGLSLSPEDVALLEECFPLAGQVALLIRPFASKVGVAGFFFRQDGSFPAATPLEFPFQ